MDPLAPVYERGLIPVVVFAMMSTISVAALLIFITQRMIVMRTHHREFVGYNQHIILIYQLLLADLLQSIAFTISLHWLRIDKILSQTVPCQLQAWFLHLGNVASGFFVLAIAINTWLGVVKGIKMPYSWFVFLNLIIWLAALVLTFLGPAMFGNGFFARAGGWCWVSEVYQRERLLLHYLWIFIVEIGTVAIYSHIFIHLRGHIKFIVNGDTTRLSRATKFMILYPFVYVVLTLPIALGRTVTMAGIQLPDTFFCIAGALLTSCGWIDALLYALTRRILLNDNVATGQSAHQTTTTTTPPGDAPEPTPDFGLHPMVLRSKDSVGTLTRTITVTGGSNRLSRLADRRRGRNATRGNGLDDGRENSTGSEVALNKPLSMNSSNIVMETNIRVETMNEPCDKRGSYVDDSNALHRAESTRSELLPCHAF